MQSTTHKHPNTCQAKKSKTCLAWWHKMATTDTKARTKAKPRAAIVPIRKDTKSKDQDDVGQEDQGPQLCLSKQRRRELEEQQHLLRLQIVKRALDHVGSGGGSTT